MFIKFISILLLVVCSLSDAKAGVTNIKEIINNTSGVVKVSKVEYTGVIFTDRSEETKDIPAGGTWSGDMWIPWANNKDEGGRHNIRLVAEIPQRAGSRTFWRAQFYIWQTGDFVRFTDKEVFVDNAPKVPGLAKVDGERRIVVSEENRRVVFKFEEYKK